MIEKMMMMMVTAAEGEVGPLFGFGAKRLQLTAGCRARGGREAEEEELDQACKIHTNILTQGGRGQELLFGSQGNQGVRVGKNVR